MEKLNTYSLQLSAFGFQHLAISGTAFGLQQTGISPKLIEIILADGRLIIGAAEQPG